MPRACFRGALLSLAWVGMVVGGDQEDMQALIDRAIEAHGGEERLSHFPAATWKATGRFFGVGDGIDYSMHGARQNGDQGYLAVESEVNGQNYRRITVVNGDRGWIRVNDRVQAMDAEALAEEKERLYANWIATLAPLKEGSFQFTPVGPIDIGVHKAVGVRLSSRGHRDITLYFDQETGLLLKKETHVRDLRQGGRDVLQETYYGNYQEADGIQVPTKLQVRWDGQLHLEGEMSETKPKEKLGTHLFLRP